MSMTVLAFRVSILAIVAVMALSAPSDAAATEPMEGRIEQITPALEAYIGKSMEAFAAPGLAIGIVADDKVVYAKGFGSRTKGGAPVDTDTVFQIGSTTKAFLATTLAMGVDRGAYGWDDRIVDLHPDFRLKD